MRQRQQFNPRQFLGKKRITKLIPSHPRISRVYVWDEARELYDIPPFGMSYIAKRYELALTGGRRRTKQFFDTLEEALNWQVGKEAAPPPISVQGTRFSDVVRDWRKRKLSLLAQTTQVAYEKMLTLYFGGLMPVPMREFNAKIVDRWLDDLKNPTGKAMRSKRRIDFDHELSLLSGILRFFREYHDEEFRNPIFHRHRDDVKTGRERRRPEKNFRQQDFQKFVEELKKEKNGALFAALATVQFYQALRISEAAAIHWEDVFLDHAPQASRLIVRRSVIWPRSKGTFSYVKIGFKNSKSNDGFKEQPLFPETYFAFKEKECETKTGLVFHLKGHHLEYRQIEFAYNKAFARACLPFRGTHIMRHGGTRLVYNATKDLEVAKQILGNSDLQTVQVYAQRDATALTDFAHERWKNFSNVVAIGRKR